MALCALNESAEQPEYIGEYQRYLEEDHNSEDRSGDNSEDYDVGDCAMTSQGTKERLRNEEVNIATMSSRNRSFEASANTSLDGRESCDRTPLAGRESHDKAHKEDVIRHTNEQPPRMNTTQLPGSPFRAGLSSNGVVKVSYPNPGTFNSATAGNFVNRPYTGKRGENVEREINVTNANGKDSGVHIRESESDDVDMFDDEDDGCDKVAIRINSRAREILKPWSNGEKTVNSLDTSSFAKVDSNLQLNDKRRRNSLNNAGEIYDKKISTEKTTRLRKGWTIQGPNSESALAQFRSSTSVAVVQTDDLGFGSDEESESCRIQRLQARELNSRDGVSQTSDTGNEDHVRQDCEDMSDGETNQCAGRSDENRGLSANRIHYQNDKKIGLNEGSDFEEKEFQNQKPDREVLQDQYLRNSGNVGGFKDLIDWNFGSTTNQNTNRSDKRGLLMNADQQRRRVHTPKEGHDFNYSNAEGERASSSYSNTSNNRFSPQILIDIHEAASPAQKSIKRPDNESVKIMSTIRGNDFSQQTPVVNYSTQTGHRLRYEPSVLLGSGIGGPVESVDLADWLVLDREFASKLYLEPFRGGVTKLLPGEDLENTDRKREPEFERPKVTIFTNQPYYITIKCI